MPKNISLIGQLAVMAAASLKTEMTPSSHVFPDRVKRNNVLHYFISLPVNQTGVTNFAKGVLPNFAKFDTSLNAFFCFPF